MTGGRHIQDYLEYLSAKDPVVSVGNDYVLAVSDRLSGCGLLSTMGLQPYMSYRDIPRSILLERVLTVILLLLSGLFCPMHAAFFVPLQVRCALILRGIGRALGQHRSTALAWQDTAEAVMREAGEDPEAVFK